MKQKNTPPPEKQARRSKIHLAAKMRKAGAHKDAFEKRIRAIKSEDEVVCSRCQDRTFIEVALGEFQMCPECWPEEPSED